MDDKKITEFLYKAFENALLDLHSKKAVIYSDCVHSCVNNTASYIAEQCKQTIVYTRTELKALKWISQRNCLDSDTTKLIEDIGIKRKFRGKRGKCKYRKTKLK